ncbi:MAG: histidine triad nucleotide-binding protein [Ruminococcaceae bacterium]|nr:histidine triad nucleotide-binding protein [Oscillospiraceae bacterium]
MDCIFCKIANGDIKTNKVYEDDKIIAFYDLEPKAPTHVLIIPKEHICCADELNESNCDIVSHIFSKIPSIAKDLSLDGYRIVNNCKENGGQTVFHLHFHLLGGTKLSGDFA